MVGFFLKIWLKVMDIPLAMAGIYSFSQNVIGLRSTCFAFEVSACIIYFLSSFAFTSYAIPHMRDGGRSKIIFIVSTRQIVYRESWIVYRGSFIVDRLTIFDQLLQSVLFIQNQKTRNQHIQNRQW